MKDTLWSVSSCHFSNLELTKITVTKIAEDIVFFTTFLLLKFRSSRIMKDEIVSLIQEKIRNRCVNPPGDEMKSIRTIERYLSSFGVESEIFESAPDRGNLLANIKGTGEGLGDSSPRQNLRFGQ